MLDVGFSEILLTSAIALIVLGPERLPKVARQVGNWMGRARVMARQLTEQLEREVSAEELLKTQTKQASTNNAGAGTSGASAPAAFDTSYLPNAPPPTPNSESTTSASPNGAPPAAYSPESASTVHGADWHASPPENKRANE
jgi:sec-independent protein translocase protein TatB